MITTINDDFNLDKIEFSGQAFRIKCFEDGTYRFVYLNHILYIKKISDTPISAEPSNYEIHSFSWKCNESSSKGGFTSENLKFTTLKEDTLEETDKLWQEVWNKYFDLSRDYSRIRHSVPSQDAFLKEASQYGEGLRILRQDPWEMLITFIISQRKSIPAIKSSVEKICEKWGTQVQTDRETLYLFPSPKQLSMATESQLAECGLGYRVSYIQNATEFALGSLNATSESKDSPFLGSDFLYSLEKLSDEALFERLKEIKGVGDKVSNCICLFAYARTASAPVDTWIAKVINHYYKGINPFPQYGDVAGIMQQYIFYYAQTHKDVI